MGKTITGKLAAICAAVAFVVVMTAFTTPSWLETDGKLEEPKFVKIGLWQVCFQGVQDSRRYFDETKFYGCWWVFEQEYYVIHEIRLPGFFVATQFFFTLCMTLLVISVSLTTLYACCSRAHDKYQLLLWVTGSNLILSGICGTVAIVIFAAQGDGHDWMPNWEHNKIGWSFTLAVVGTVLTNFAGILFYVEARRNKNNLLRTVDDMRRSHTEI